jgi:hypothetical protein
VIDNNCCGRCGRSDGPLLETRLHDKIQLRIFAVNPYWSVLLVVTIALQVAIVLSIKASAQRSLYTEHQCMAYRLAQCEDRVAEVAETSTYLYTQHRPHSLIPDQRMYHLPDQWVLCIHIMPIETCKVGIAKYSPQGCQIVPLRSTLIFSSLKLHRILSVRDCQVAPLDVSNGR